MKVIKVKTDCCRRRRCYNIVIVSLWSRRVLVASLLILDYDATTSSNKACSK